jgi:hypothetical protein
MTLKELGRQVIGLITVLPTAFKVWATTPFLGKERAVAYWGPGMTAMAKWSLRFWVPQIASAADFDLFQTKMKANFRLWRPLFDIHIEREDHHIFQLKVKNCPFCQALFRVGLPELAPYVCQGDWEKARDNADKWVFERNCQIGTGDSYCDHTYLRKPD